MSKEVFVDTSAFYAARDSSDQYHTRAVAGFDFLKRKAMPMITTDHIVAESATLIRRKLGYNEVKEFLQGVEVAEALGVLRVQFVAPADLTEATRVFLDSGDPRLSFVDALSVVVARKRKVKTVFAFDVHFQQAGLNMLSTEGFDLR